MAKTIEQRIETLKAGGFLKPEDSTGADGARRTLMDLFELGTDRSESAESSNYEKVLADIPADLRPFLSDAGDLRSENGSRPTLEQLIELGKTRAQVAKADREISSLRADISSGRPGAASSSLTATFMSLEGNEQSAFFRKHRRELRAEQIRNIGGTVGGAHNP